MFKSKASAKGQCLLFSDDQIPHDAAMIVAPPPKSGGWMDFAVSVGRCR
jgi:hypothetical protein